MCKLLLCEHIKDIALILALVHSLSELPPAGSLVISDAGIVSGHDTVKALAACMFQQSLEFQKTVAVDAGIRRVPSLVLRPENTVLCNSPPYPHIH
jgi:hypothetical protein